MRRARIKTSPDEEEAVYHLISRTVNGEWMLDPTGREILRRQIWQVAEFAGLEVITYAILSNHFHVLVRVPRREALNDEELLRRYQILYPRPTRHQTAKLDVIKSQLQENGPEALAWRKRMLSLMFDVSQYMKLVKCRFSIWHNRKHKRFGPVWSDRFKSLLVESKDRLIEIMAAYIDLNCVRAGIAMDPKEYRFCGYAEAVAGNERAQRGLASIVGGNSWNETQAAYRQLVFATGTQPRQGKAEISADRCREVMRQGGKLPISEILRCRIRYFSQGAVLGSTAFVESQLDKYRQKFGGCERTKARQLPSIADWGDLAGLRQLRGNLFA